MNWTTSCARAASNESSANGSSSADAELDVDARVAGTGGIDERLRRIDRGDGAGTDPRDELGRQRARATADVDHALAGRDPGEVGELRREQHRVPAHEPVVRVRGDVEEHVRYRYVPTTVGSCAERTPGAGLDHLVPDEFAPDRRHTIRQHSTRESTWRTSHTSAGSWFRWPTRTRRSRSTPSTLGFSLAADVPFGDGDRWVEVAPPGGGAAIALVPPQGDYQPGRMTGIALESPDPKADHAELIAAGVDVDEELMGGDGIVPLLFFFRDHDGNHLMIVETQAG